jgi:tRNA(Arg) A34 adenosine deaminase TadA
VALEQARLAASLGEVPVGAVVVRNDSPISTHHVQALLVGTE